MNGTVLHGTKSSGFVVEIRRLGAGIRLDNVRGLFGNGDDRSDGVPADLVREDRRVDDAEALDAEDAQARVDDARLGGRADASGRRLQR